MNKKDYKAIAEIIKNNKDETTVGGVKITISNVNLISELADYFEKDNPKFDRQKFYKGIR
jgi:hypothetical protein